jgi:L-rhamnose mutarotase
LEYRLRDLTHRDIEVVNAGINGSGPDQYYLRFSDEVDVYHPNIVIFVVFADNDFGDLIRTRLFDLGPSGELVETKFTRTVDSELQRHPLQDFASNSLLVSGVRKFWRTVTQQNPSMLNTFLSLNEKEYSVYTKHQPKLFTHFAYGDYDADLALFPSSEAAKTKIGLMNGVLRKAKQLADSKEVKFLVIIEPSSKDLTTNMEPNYKTFETYPGYKRTNLSSFVERICVENQIPYINLWEPFLKNHPENLYFKEDDVHWNDAGQDLGAGEAARFIADHFLSK